MKFSPVVASLVQWAKLFPDKPALVVGDRPVTYQKLVERAVTLAGWLEDNGLGYGERVVLQAGLSLEFVAGYFATHLARALAVPLSPNIPNSAKKEIVSRVSPKAVFNGVVWEVAGRVFTPGAISKPSRRSGDHKFPNQRDPADILFTSGTTGRAKGVVLTQGNIAAAATNINAFIGNSNTDYEVVPLPLSHSFGLGRLRCQIVAGGTLILVAGLVPPKTIFAALEKYPATGLSLVPSGIRLVRKLTGNYLGKFSDQLKYMEIGSSSLSTEEKESLGNLLPKTRLCMHYGLTEASRAAFLEFHRDTGRLSSVGKATPNVTIAIVNDEFKRVANQVEGEIAVKGGMVMKEYWQDKSLTTKSLRNGWFLTSDLGYLDRLGYLYLTGRKSELINVGGLKVHPEEVEEVLCQNKLIADCACVGVPDPAGVAGQVVVAFLVPKSKKRLPSRSQLVNFLRDRLEPYKIPVFFHWIRKIPRTDSGKIQRNRLPNVGYPSS